jgi:hypothetical protein
MATSRSVAASAPFVLVLTALLACKGSDKAAGSSASASAGADPAAAPVASPDIGADKMGTFVCKEIKDDACVSETARFAVDSPVVHVTYKTESVPKNGEVFTMQWIAEDVGSAAKPNTVIATVEKKVAELPDFGVKNYVVNTQLSKPTAGWPVGKYRVEIKLSGALVTTARFEVAQD